MVTVQLSGYQILDQLYTGNRTLVYQGRRLADQKPVVIKLLRSEYPSFSELVQIRHQYTIAKNLNCPEIIQTYSLVSYRNSYCVVMEDFGGISLKAMIEEWEDGRLGGTAEGLREFLAIAIQIASGLDGLYCNRVIHKDIKPANILMNKSTKQVKLIDFSISSVLPRETQTPASTNILEGTLTYISPEQTGRMNRGVDYRSDFYSLGITFYELLTGQLPFESNDPMELVYCHLAKQPPPVSSICQNVPPIVSDLVSKLMAKNAEDRYQSALGLKQDLEICLYHLQNTGSIPAFTLGQRDRCDRFLIPEKLYGRQAEVKALLTAFERVSQGSKEIMLVAGFSGIGKTAVVHEVQKPIVRARGYFIKGKFDQFQRNIPFFAFVQAFRDLMGQLLSESDAQLQRWKSKVLAALGENAQVMIDVIPELESIIDQQPTVPKLSDSAAQNRFNLLLLKFIQIFTTKEHPLVIFLDDLQWADSASLNLMQLLMCETDTSHLLLIGAYRDNEVKKSHPLMLVLSAIQKAQISVHTITLAPLDQASLNQLVADTLSCSLQLALPLTELVIAKTQGNPFFSTQFLKVLYEDGLIVFVQIDISNPTHRGSYWRCDIAQIRALSITDDVVEFVGMRLQKLPPEAQSVLKLAACIGNQFDLHTLSIVYEKSQEQTATALWKALEEGLIIPKSKIYNFFPEESVIDSQEQWTIDNKKLTIKYKFIHDRIQQAAYFLIPENQKKITHLKIGQLLLYNTSTKEQEEQIFEIVNQLNIGADLITQQAQRDELAQLNLMAGYKAKTSTAHTSALEYLTTGIQLLDSDCWQNQYDLTLALYELASVAAYLSGNFEQMNHLFEVVLQHAKTFLDTVKVYEVRIQAYAAQHQLLEAVNTGIKMLQLLGVEFPQQPTQAEINNALLHTQLVWEEKGLSELINLPLMNNSSQLAAMKILSSISGASYLAVPEIYTLVVLQQVNLSLQYGNASGSAHGYANYGLILCGEFGDIGAGFQFGQLALSLVQQLNAKELQAKIHFIVNCFIKHWQEPLREILNPLQSAYTVGLETGDLASAAYCAFKYCAYSYFAGKELPALEQEIASFSEALHQLNQTTVFNYCAIHHQVFFNLMNESENPSYLVGTFYDEEKMLPFHQEANDRNGIFYLYLNKLILSYLFGENQQAIENAVLAEKYLRAVKALAQVPIFYLYDSLARLAMYKYATKPEQEEFLLKVNANQVKMQKWAILGSENYLHKFYLVEAERYRVLDQKLEAIEMYDRAIAKAKENKFLQEEALANELAAKFYQEWSKEKIAQTYIIEAYYCYSHWGARTKVEDLEKRYFQLLTPILQHRDVTAETVIQETLSSTITSKSGKLDALDLASVLKASQSLTSEIQLFKLIPILMQVVLENAGAKKVALLLLKGEDFEIVISEKVGDDNSTTRVQSIPIEKSDEIPVTLLNYVKRTQETLVIDDAAREPSLNADPYIQQHQPKSLLCTPLLRQGKLIGLLYLENNLITGAFTKERVKVLHILCSQAAISLEKAKLYQDLQQSEAGNREKATQLEQSLQQLQQAQLQVVQNEKMATLGGLVAGIAHEINNPVGFIEGNLYYAQSYVQDVLEHLQLYQHKFPNPGDDITNHAKTIDLKLLVEDLPAIVTSMKTGSERIRNLSISLRTFSRSDTVHKVPCDIHDGIDSTLLILKYRLKASEQRPAIEVIKDYGLQTNVECFLGQMNQVFMNIFANAIDAIDETIGKKGKIAIPSPCIQIQTKLLEPSETIPQGGIFICIKDNGPGMPQEVRAKIFDHMFTTKTVGKGTGLGLSIARQIVEDIHGGKLSCVSALGHGTEFSIQLPI